MVIGNGFDIAHELNTQYEDFIHFCSIVEDSFTNHQNDFLKQLRVELNKVFKKKSVSQKAEYYFSEIIKGSENYKFILSCKNNYWLSYVQKNKDFMGNKWSDFEFIIAEQIEILSYISNHFDSYTQNEEVIKTKYANRLTALYEMISAQNAPSFEDFQYRVDKVRQKLVKELDDLTWMLEIYLTRFLYRKSKTIELFELLPITKLISFNYTNTYSKMYHNQIVDSHYIHGIAVKDRPVEQNNMVFGIGTEIKNTSPDDKYNYVEYQKYYQRIIKKTGNTYTKWLNNKEQKYIYFFGHSLDSVDGDIIKNLIYSENSKIVIFYYDHKAMKFLVMNLVKILGKEDLIQFTNEEKIVFLKSDDIKGVKQFVELSNSSEINMKVNKRKVRSNKETVGIL